MKQHRIILGRDRQDAETRRDAWLADHPEIKLLRMHKLRSEPRTLLTWIGGRDVPRVSIMLEYE